MAEVGIDISNQYSKSMDVFRGKDLDLVVSVCKSSVKLTCALCASPMIDDKPRIVNETLPEAKHYLHHPFDDPSEVDGTEGGKLEAFRRIRDEMKDWILSYFGKLNG